MMNKPRPQGTHTSKVVATNEPVNTIRMDSVKLNRFLTERDAMSAKNEGPLKRGFVRWAFRSVAVSLSVVHPGGSSTKFNVACRNLSSGGIGVLHSAFIYNGTKCVIELKGTNGQMQTIEGTVLRCSHVQGTIHEIGIKFTKPIDPHLFISLDPFADGFSLENVNPESLRGVVLYIEESTLDQAMVRHYLRETQVQLIVASTLDDAMQKVMNGVDLILCDQNLGDTDGAEVIKKLRESGLSQPILMVTADTSNWTRQKLITAQCNAFITKPLKQTTLFRALGEFMMLNTAGGGMNSTLTANHPNAGMLDTFVHEIKEYAKQIETAVAANDAAKVRGLCLQIKGSAPAMGFDRLAELADAAQNALSAKGTIADSIVPVRTLMSACQRASNRVAA